MALKREPVAHEYAPVLIRALRKHDLCSCQRIDRAAFPEADRWSETDWSDITEISPTFVAVQGTAVVGYAVVAIRPKRIEITRIAVCYKTIRRGIGTLLVGRVVTACQESGRKFVKVTLPLTAEGNRLSPLQFFKSLGWQGFLKDGEPWERGELVTFVKEV